MPAKPPGRTPSDASPSFFSRQKNFDDFPVLSNKRRAEFETETFLRDFLAVHDAELTGQRERERERMRESVSERENDRKRESAP